MNVHVLKAVTGLLVLLGFLAYGNTALASHRVMKMSKHKFEETVDRVKKAIEHEGMKVMNVIDHEATLKEAGVTKWKWVVIEFISPKYAKEVLDVESSADVDIPLRISVMDGDPKDPHGAAPHASYYKPSVLFADYKKLSKVGKELDKILEKIVGSIAAPVAAKGH